MSKVNMIFAGLEESKATNFKLIKPKKKKKKEKKKRMEASGPMGPNFIIKIINKVC